MKCCIAVKCSYLNDREPLSRAKNTGPKLSQQLTISSLFSALALVTLALVARAGDLSAAQAYDPALVQAEAPINLDA